MLKKPAWLLFAEDCRTKFGNMKGTKSGRREEQCIRDWWREACQDYDYPGTVSDWFCLFRWRGRR
jgi:hypothetical protein